MSGFDLRHEVVELARRLIRLDTSNPPGNETQAAELLAAYLEGAGVECELVGPDPARLNLIARVSGSGDGPSLMLLAHTDVVPAPPEGWSVGPFDGAVRDGRLIGRGAVDMKNELAARVVALAALAQNGASPAGDVVLVAEADEEGNRAGVGMSWLVRERPDVRCDCALNEGGGSLLELADGRRLVTVSVGEKQVTALRLRVFGRGGHASVPTAADNPLRHLAAAIERLLIAPGPTRRVAAVDRALAILGVEDPTDSEAIAGAAALHPLLVDLLPAMTRMTVTPTGVRSLEPANVIPPFADVVCDVRALPGQSEADVRAHVDNTLGSEFEYEIDFVEPLQGGTESPIDTPLYRLLAEYVAEHVPGAELLPMISTGFTDSHWIRTAFETAAYGFAPVFSDDPRAYSAAAHADDESLSVLDLAEMAEFHLHAVSALGHGR